MKHLILIPLLLSSFFLSAQAASQAAPQKPEWCRSFPAPLTVLWKESPSRIPWFEVYRIRPGVFAIYEPHQSEEIISYLILGKTRALLFDTGMGISNIREVVEGLTSLPVSVLNSHTHDDHVGDNWRFSDIYGMDTDFTRTNAKGSREDAQAEIAPGEVCGTLPPGFNPADYSTKPFHISHWMHDHDKIDLGDRLLEIIATPGHTPDAIALLDKQNGLLFTGDSFYVGPIWLFRPETDLDAYVESVKKWPPWFLNFNCCCPPTILQSPNQVICLALSKLFKRYEAAR